MIAIKMLHGYSYASLDCTNSSHKAERAAVAMSLSIVHCLINVHLDWKQVISS
jgi:hypothetical protein